MRGKRQGAHATHFIDKHGQVQSNPEINLEILKWYYTNLYTAACPNPQADVFLDQTDLSTWSEGDFF